MALHLHRIPLKIEHSCHSITVLRFRSWLNSIDGKIMQKNDLRWKSLVFPQTNSIATTESPWWGRQKTWPKEPISFEFDRKLQNVLSCLGCFGIAIKKIYYIEFSLMYMTGFNWLAWKILPTLGWPALARNNNDPLRVWRRFRWKRIFVGNGRKSKAVGVIHLGRHCFRDSWYYRICQIPRVSIGFCPCDRFCSAGTVLTSWTVIVLWM